MGLFYLLPVENQTPTYWNPFDYSTTVPATCVIAQQCSSATFVSLCFHFRKEKCHFAFQKYYFNFLLVLKKCVTLKLRNFKLQIVLQNMSAQNTQATPAVTRRS